MSYSLYFLYPHLYSNQYNTTYFDQTQNTSSYVTTKLQIIIHKIFLSDKNYRKWRVYN